VEKSFEEVLRRIVEMEFVEDFDTIVAIANGGILPASLINERLNIDFQLIKINFRDEVQRPRYEHPRLLEPLAFDPAGRRILLVDDRIKTGSTIVLAKEILSAAALIRTFAVNGTADYAVYDEACFRFPWKGTDLLRKS
jgi:xanthine phosphoribosyltransferase